MASTITDQQSGSLESRREGVDVLTKKQQYDTSILRLRPNSNDLLVFSGRVVDDNFFDENLIDMDMSGSLTNAPSSFAEKRTLGQGASSEIVFTDVADFDPVAYIADEGLALYPVILSAAGYADPVAEDGNVAVFETRREIAGLYFMPDYAKKGAKASICETVESTGKNWYFLSQEKPRSRESYPTAEKYFEIGENETAIISMITYQDQDPSLNDHYLDSSDSAEASEWSSWDTPNGSAGDVNDEIAAVIASGLATSYEKDRDSISASAGWTFLNVLNGTDSIVYSDRM